MVAVDGAQHLSETVDVRAQTLQSRVLGDTPSVHIRWHDLYGANAISGEPVVDVPAPHPLTVGMTIPVQSSSQIQTSIGASSAHSHDSSPAMSAVSAAVVTRCSVLDLQLMAALVQVASSVAVTLSMRV